MDQVRDVIKHYKHEKDSEAHVIFRQSAGHKPKGIVPQLVNPEEETVPGIEHPGSTGVIYCSERAIANGFSYTESHAWANLGQGAPEVGPIPNAPPRPSYINMPTDSLEYAPTTGVKALREAVANLYNHTYRKGKASQYTYENVCIVPGGRSGLSRLAAVVGDATPSRPAGLSVPDYTAYDQVLSAFRRLVPVPTALDPAKKYRLDIEQVKRDIFTQGLAVILASNPRNPTGQVIQGKDLKELVQLGREGTTIILDEFYSWYLYPDSEKDYGKSVSSAEFIEDVDTDAVVIVDGLTKVSLQKHFKHKRDHVLKRLHDLGKAPGSLNNGLTFFEELLKEQTIVIPGIFFDINPSHRRNLFHSPCHHFVRLSFGPPLEDLDKGLDAMARVLKKAKKEGMKGFGHNYKKSIDGESSPIDVRPPMRGHDTANTV
ncbi:hypothetical protein AAF712_011677 [Marasmius tenuissimus]|uniref:Aminotransferase class I/classII large domain-containing protein n=1 Tax=Marasmius tenuissimus TaxID=585030 RepID=A0ABR2ZKE9_9AGAR